MFRRGNHWRHVSTMTASDGAVTTGALCRVSPNGQTTKIQGPRRLPPLAPSSSFRFSVAKLFLQNKCQSKEAYNFTCCRHNLRLDPKICRLLGWVIRRKPRRHLIWRVHISSTIRIWLESSDSRLVLLHLCLAHY
jgi:hypothetical protein